MIVLVQNNGENSLMNVGREADKVKWPEVFGRLRLGAEDILSAL
jgi:hypothetical protein